MQIIQVLEPCSNPAKTPTELCHRDSYRRTTYKDSYRRTTYKTYNYNSRGSHRNPSSLDRFQKAKSRSRIVALCHDLTRRFFSGPFGPRPSMEVRSPRVNVIENCPVYGGFEPTPKVGRVGSFDKHEMPPRHVRNIYSSRRLHSRFSLADVSERPANDSTVFSTRLLIKLTTLPSLILTTLTPKIKS